MRFFKNSFFICFLLWQTVQVNAQGSFYNNGALFFINGATSVDGFKVHANMDFTQVGDSLYLGNGSTFSVAGHFTNNGKVSGNGTYAVQGDWTNNGVFKEGWSTVILSGGNQSITGSSPLIFYDLTTIDSAGDLTTKKLLTKNAVVRNILNLTNSELHTNQFELKIDNGNTTAIRRKNGFVSSATSGYLSRKTNQINTYMFPLGASTGSKVIYAPVEVVPTTTNTDYYLMRLSANKADFSTTDSLKTDTSICKINTDYYHIINHQLVNPFDLMIHVDQYAPAAIRDKWDNLANWHTGQSFWKLLGNTEVVYTDTAFGISRDNWTLTYVRYVLVDSHIGEATIYGDTSVCVNSPSYPYVGSGVESSTYDWQVSKGTITSDSTTTKHIDIDWYESGVGEIIMSEHRYISFCPSSPDTVRVTVHPKPMNGLLYTSDYRKEYDLFTYDILTFTDSLETASPVEWDFGDGIVINDQKTPAHLYEKTGDFTVTLISVDTITGCYDTSAKVIQIKEGIAFENVFTPNGDGVNDFFQVRNSGVEAYHIQIFDRWGVLLFESTSPSFYWDGKSLSGVDAPAGTYYFILLAKTAKEDIKKVGYFSLLR